MFVLLPNMVGVISKYKIVRHRLVSGYCHFSRIQYDIQHVLNAIITHHPNLMPYLFKIYMGKRHFSPKPVNCSSTVTYELAV